MSFRAVLLILVLLSGIAVAAFTFLNLQSGPQATAHAEAGIIVAAVGVPTGHLIQPQDLKFAPPTGHESSASVFERPIAASSDQQAEADRKTIDDVVGAVARRRFEPGDPIVRGSVVKPGDSGFLAAVLQPGMRAITIGVTAVSGAGGLIYPGDRVDVILTQTFNTPDISLDRRSAAEIVGRDLRVLAIDQQLQAKAQQGPEGKLAQTVTLETDPHQASAIAVAEKLGDLSLTIRSLQNGLVTANNNGAQTASIPPSPASAAPGYPQGIDGPTTGPGQGNAVWGSDVSRALRQIAAEKPKNLGGSAQVVTITVMHGDKAETITNGEKSR